MVKELMHDPLFLARKARTATKEDLSVGQDLLETLLAHRATCVGMAGNMIGEAVAVIAFFDGDSPVVMYNPEIFSVRRIVIAPTITFVGFLGIVFALLYKPRDNK